MALPSNLSLKVSPLSAFAASAQLEGSVKCLRYQPLDRGKNPFLEEAFGETVPLCMRCVGGGGGGGGVFVLFQIVLGGRQRENRGAV